MKPSLKAENYLRENELNCWWRKKAGAKRRVKQNTSRAHGCHQSWRRGVRISPGHESIEYCTVVHVHVPQPQSSSLFYAQQGRLWESKVPQQKYSAWMVDWAQALPHARWNFCYYIATPPIDKTGCTYFFLSSVSSVAFAFDMLSPILFTLYFAKALHPPLPLQLVDHNCYASMNEKSVKALRYADKIYWIKSTIPDMLNKRDLKISKRLRNIMR